MPKIMICEIPEEEHPAFLKEHIGYWWGYRVKVASVEDGTHALWLFLLFLPGLLASFLTLTTRSVAGPIPIRSISALPYTKPPVSSPAQGTVPP